MATRFLHGDDGSSMSGMGGGFSGSVGGHVFPGSFFVGVSIFFLILTTQRLFKCDSIEDFCATHIPERNPKVLRRVGLVAVVGTLLGICVEGVGGELFLGEAPHPFFQNLQHITLYTLFFFSGVVGVLESVNMLPKDAFRAATATAFFAEAIIWNEHAQMKMNLVDQRIHVLVAFTCLGSFIMMIISIYKPDHMLPFVGGFLFMLWQGLWLFAAAYNIRHLPHFDLEEMTSYFILEGVALGLCVLIVSVCWYRKCASQGLVKDDAYARVQLSHVDDDDDDDEIPVSIRQNGTDNLRVV